MVHTWACQGENGEYVIMRYDGVDARRGWEQSTEQKRTQSCQLDSKEILEEFEEKSKSLLSAFLQQ